MKDRRTITSPINGRKGGRPKIWNISPYDTIKYCNANPTPENIKTANELKTMLERRRKNKLKNELKKSHKRPDLALKEIQTQKQRRTKKLAELRYLRMLIRRMAQNLDDMKTGDLDLKRNLKLNQTET
jgi:hypothetical protein